MSRISLDEYEPMDPSCQQDPFPYYAALREQAPVFKSPKTGFFFVSRMAEVTHVLQNPGVFSSAVGTPGAPPRADGLEAEMREALEGGFPPVNTMLTADPPLQTRYRKTVGKAFNTRRIQSFEDSIRGLTDELIDRFPERGRVDFMKAFSVPLPVRVISSFLSVPPERDGDVKRWSDDSVAAIGTSISPERALEVAKSLVEMQRYLADLLEERRREGQDDFLTELTRATFEDETGRVRELGIPEMLSIIQQLMVAGNETTTKAINELMKLLIENPEEWERIQADPSTIPALVEEGLRMASPNQGLFRVVTCDTEIEGEKIPKGSMVWVMFGSANRDERVFPEPDRFDPTRSNLNEHVAFGRGAHFCIGAPLARLELRVVFEQLASRLEGAAFAPDNRLEYEPSFILRGLRGLSLDVVRRS